MYNYITIEVPVIDETLAKWKKAGWRVISMGFHSTTVGWFLMGKGDV